MSLSKFLNLKKKAKRPESTHRPVNSLVGDNQNFAVAEAYRLLRVNLSFCASGSGNCRVIGATSSLRGEGKSTTTMNLAYTLAMAGYNICLIEGDLRLPNISKNLRLARRPGLSNVLAGQCPVKQALQTVPGYENFQVIVCGDIPPNPSELLESVGMRELLDDLATRYDYILVDLPPVTVVPDALGVSKFLDGMVVVVRQEYCTKNALKETMRQLEMCGVKMLGFVMSNSTTQQKSYSRYGKQYGYGYGYGSNKRVEAHD